MNVLNLIEKKQRGEKIVALTAYDFPTARWADEAGCDIVLVGDSLGMEELGFETTLPVTMEIMLHHLGAVRRAVSRALLLADMPFLSYQINSEEALRNAGRLMQLGANAVKLEGGAEIAETVRRLTQAGIPVAGHLGFTPQSVNLIGVRMQGKDEESADRLLADALSLEHAGAAAVVLELIPDALGERISGALKIPTIGIGAGPGCDGQVLVSSDLLGLRPERAPFKHAPQYAQLGNSAIQAMARYAADVRSGVFPIPRSRKGKEESARSGENNGA